MGSDGLKMTGDTRMEGGAGSRHNSGKRASTKHTHTHYELLLYTNLPSSPRLHDHTSSAANCPVVRAAAAASSSGFFLSPSFFPLSSPPFFFSTSMGAMDFALCVDI